MGVIWASGYGEQKYKGVSAPKVLEEIESIGESATPQQIVDKARDEGTELHKCFTWNDAVAAEKWRLEEARQIRYFLRIQDDQKPDAPQYHALYYTGSGEGYKTADRVFTVPDEYAALLARARGELKAFAKKYHTLKDDLGEILELIEQL